MSSLGQQYSTAQNLNARIDLHRKFSTNPYGWGKWVFDQLEITPNLEILELGCGTASLWKSNISRIPSGLKLILSDASPGMINDARLNLSESGNSFKFEVMDAQAIPYPEYSFDKVIANHMLYHVPDRKKAIAEIHRVLKPGGKLYATTIGINNMHELAELVAAFDSAIKYPNQSIADRFGLENGIDQLKDYFDDIQIRRHEDSLRVTESQPLVDYVLSMGSIANSTSKINGPRLDSFRAFIEQKLCLHDGQIVISKEAGMFTAQK